MIYLKLAGVIAGIALIMVIAVTAPVLLWLWMPTQAGVMGLCCLGTVLTLGALAFVIVKSIPSGHVVVRPPQPAATPQQRRTYLRMVGRKAIEYDAATHRPVNSRPALTRGNFNV